MRPIDDSDYLSFLPTPLHRNRYLRWKAEMEANLDSILAEFTQTSVEETMANRGLTPKDVALLVRLHYLTEEEIETHGLRGYEEMIPT